MASVKRVFVNGVKHVVEVGGYVVVVVQDEKIERHFTFSDQLGEVIFDEEDEDRDSAIQDYEDVNSFCAADYEPEEDDDDEDFEDEDEDDMEDMLDDEEDEGFEDEDDDDEDDPELADARNNHGQGDDVIEGVEDDEKQEADYAGNDFNGNALIPDSIPAALDPRD